MPSNSQWDYANLTTARMTKKAVADALMVDTTKVTRIEAIVASKLASANLQIENLNTNGAKSEIRAIEEATLHEAELAPWLAGIPQAWQLHLIHDMVTKVLTHNKRTTKRSSQRSDTSPEPSHKKQKQSARPVAKTEGATSYNPLHGPQSSPPPPAFSGFILHCRLVAGPTIHDDDPRESFVSMPMMFGRSSSSSSVLDALLAGYQKILVAEKIARQWETQEL